MFVVHAHPSRYHQRPRRAFDPFELVLEQPRYSLVPEPALVDPVEVARARYMHALDEQRAAREAYTVHHLRTFQDEAAAYLLQQQQQQQVLAAREEARQRAIHARRQQIIQARREEELRRRRQEREENEFAQALMLAFELANQVQPAPVERAPARARCACTHAAAAPIAGLASAASRTVHRVSSVPVLSPPPRPTPAPQPRVRFSPPQATSPAPGIPVSRPAAAPVPLKPVLKRAAPPTASPASVRIPIRESKGKSSSHVRVNATETPVVQPALSPADAIAALMMLEADLDALTPTTTAAPLLKHQLNTILESVDAIESGGHDAVRDVRRALVQRIEEALVAAEQGEPAFARPQRAAGITINEPASTRIEVKVPSAPAAAVPISIPVVAHEPVTPQPSVVDDLVDVSQPGPAELDVVPTPSAAVEGYVIDDFLVPEVSAPADTTSVVPEPDDRAAVAEAAKDMLDDLAFASLESATSPTPLVAEFVTSSAVDEPVTDERDVEGETVSPALPDDITGEGSTSSDAASVDESTTAPSAAESPATPASHELAADASSSVTGDEGRAPLDAPTSVPSATTRTPSPALPSETPLAASYPPAQTFAAPTHPPVDTGSDGEWERTSGSEGEKSDYEVV